MSKPVKARTKNLIGGLTVSETTEKIYAIAIKCQYVNRTDWEIENKLQMSWVPVCPEDFEWLTTVLIPRHGSASVKIGCGISEIAFGRNSRFAFRTAKRIPCCMYIKRTDGSIVDVSWRECLSPSHDRAKVMNAMRNSVRPQIREFLDAIKPEQGCQICGVLLSGKETDIDHHPKPFKQIVEDWFQATNRDCEKIVVCGEKDLQVGDDFVDQSIKLEWTVYHRESTIDGLRALCRPCHSTLKRT